jgi:hypothetical protein
MDVFPPIKYTGSQPLLASNRWGGSMSDYRLGDDIDDYCVKCKRLTNQSILAIVDGEPVKVRCRACYHEQPYRRGEIPPSKKDLKKAELFKEVLSSIPAADAPKSGEPGAK